MEFLTAIVGSIAGEIAKYTVAPIGRQIGYLVFYNRNINDLKSKLQKLHDKKSGVDLQVNHAERNLRDLPPEVKTWQNQVDAVNGEAAKFLEDEEIERKKKCCSGLCRNPKSVHSLSRKATKMSQEVVVLLEDAEKFHFDEFACPRPPPPLGSTFITEGIKDFDSRISLMKDILKALMDDSLSMMSICGLGGVGKTTMVKELVKVVETHKLFGEVAMSTVSQNPNVKNIQLEIASCLGLELEEDTDRKRAIKLHERIVKSKSRLLLVLDDVWNELDFEEIGIPVADEWKVKCTIVLTSRREDECNKIGSQRNFRIDALSNEEGWDLFEGIAFTSDSVDNRDLRSIAKQIAAECDGLPIAIVTIAKALKKKRESVWLDALNQLQRSNLKGVSGMGKVYSRLELSYNLLEREEAKSCFLLCCLFPEDYDIRVEDLVRYGMGLRLLENVDSIQQARNRVYGLVDELKESFLLLDSDKDDHDQYVKMHDVVRDMAISIASKQNSYIISCIDEIKKWPETDSYEDCRAISLRCKQMKEHPSYLNCPKLELVRLEYQKGSKSLPGEFFEGMKELKVLDLNIPSLPDSLPVLEKLRTLYLPDLEEIGHVRNVEILTIRDKQFPMIPKEVGSMGKLRLLDLRGMVGLRYIPKGVLSSLSNLEELYVGSFMKWGSSVYYDSDSSVDEKDYCGIGGEVNADLDELESLPLTSLQICVPKPFLLPKESVFANLARFSIIIKISIFGDRTPELDSIDSENGLELEGDASEIRSSGICVVLKKTENLILYDVKNLKSVWHELGSDGFPLLKRITIKKCRALQHLVNISHVSSSSQLSCFSNLRDIRILSCDNLNYLFPVSMASRLSQLRSIYVDGCKRMDGLFYGKEEDDEVGFPNLIKLEIDDVPELKGLWVNMNNEATKIPTPFLSHWIRLSNLQVLVIRRCRLLKVAFSNSVAEKLVQLKTLTIRDCEQMEYIVATINGGGEEEEDTRTSRSVFPVLTSITIRDLPQLVKFFQDGNFFCDWHSLKKIMVDGCPKMKTLVAQTHTNLTVASSNETLFKIPPEFKGSLSVEVVDVEHCANLTNLFSSHVAKRLVKLQRLSVTRCKKIEEIISKEEEGEEEDISKIVFPHLKSMYLDGLQNLRSFYNGVHSIELSFLKDLQFDESNFRLKTFLFDCSLNPKKMCINGKNYSKMGGRVTIDTIKEQMLKKVNISCVEDYTILCKLKHDDLSRIQDLQLSKCENLLDIFPRNWITTFPRLEKLLVKRCDAAEKIFDTENEASSMIFSHLEEITLEDLKNLKHIFNKTPKRILGFQKLEKLAVKRCSSVQEIFEFEEVSQHFPILTFLPSNIWRISSMCSVTFRTTLLGSKS